VKHPLVQNDRRFVMKIKKGNLSINITTNIINLSLSIVVGLFLVPYLIRSLGVESYGMISLANYFVQYMVIASLALDSAVGRYIAIALEKGEIEESIRIFNTAFWSDLIVMLFLIIVSIPILLFLDTIINIPQGAGYTSRLLFLCTFAGFFLSLATSPFAVSSWCLNRFDLLNGINIARQAVYLVLIVVLFTIFKGNLILVGIAILISAITTAMLNCTVSRHLLPHLRISPGYFDSAVLRRLFSTGGWLSINKIGSILYLNIDLFVVNRFLGAFASGQYAAVLQLSMVIRMLAAAISSVFGPPLVYLFAHNDLPGLSLYARRAVKFLGLIVALPIGLACGFAAPVLTLWVGEQFGTLSTLMVILIFHLSVNVAVYPLFELQTATNRVRLPGLVTCIMGVANFALALSVAAWTNFGIYGVAIAGALMLTLKNALFTPIYSAHIIGEPWYVFLKELIHTVLATCTVLLTARSVLRYIEVDTWSKLISLNLLISIIYCIVVWICLSREERGLILGKIGDLIGRVYIAYGRK
jgi:membrane protein EpsK